MKTFKTVPANKIGAAFSQSSDEWATPQDFFNKLHQEFSFDIDGAADTTNHKCPLWFGPGGVEKDALTCEWAGTIWLNPPYTMVKEFLAKACAERLKGVTTVALIPSRTDTKMWHKYIWDDANHCCRPGVSVRFIQGRLKFLKHTGVPIRTSFQNKKTGVKNTGAPFPSVLVVLTGVSP